MVKPSVRQIKAARALLKWTQSDLAEASGVSLPSIERLEMQDGDLKAYASTVDALVSALRAGGATFDLDDGDGPGVRLISS